MSTFDYRRSLSRAELAKLAAGALGTGAAVAGVAFYLGRIWLQRVPLPSGEATYPAAAAAGGRDAERSRR